MADGAGRFRTLLRTQMVAAEHGALADTPASTKTTFAEQNDTPFLSSKFPLLIPSGEDRGFCPLLYEELDLE